MSHTASASLHHCQCPHCQQAVDTPEQDWHHQINLFMSRLDEQQRRWFAALEAKRLGHGGIRLMSTITGLDESTIRRGKRELAEGLRTRPLDRVRMPGGGRKRAEKKILNC